MRKTININTPWYKQFWPWFLIFLPATAVVASIATLVLAIENEDSLVVDDYYKKAMEINRDLSKIEYAENIGLSGGLSVEGNKLYVEMSALQNKIELANEIKLPPVVTVFFNHPTQASKDFFVILIQSQQVIQNNKIKAVYNSRENTKAVSLLKHGAWYVRLLPADKTWQLNGKIKNKTSIQLFAD